MSSSKPRNTTHLHLTTKAISTHPSSTPSHRNTLRSSQEANYKSKTRLLLRLNTVAEKKAMKRTMKKMSMKRTEKA